MGVVRFSICIQIRYPGAGKGIRLRRSHQSKFKRSDTSVSLDSWHDSMHVLVGTGGDHTGHMVEAAVAGVKSNVNKPFLINC